MVMKEIQTSTYQATTTICEKEIATTSTGELYDKEGLYVCMFFWEIVTLGDFLWKKIFSQIPYMLGIF